MKKKIIVINVLVACLELLFGVPAVIAANDKSVELLLARMTLKEKIGQMVLLDCSWEKPILSREKERIEYVRKSRCGNIFNYHTAAYTRKLQKIAVEETRLGIPLLFGYDIIHGYKTMFPISLGESASWDLKAIERSARVSAVEATAGGLHWTFAPMVDIARDPRWGRISEGAGEDTYLACEIARARVRGFQGKDLADASTMLSCAKHFAAYGAAQAGRDYHTVDISERVLREVYLPPFRAAIDAGALSIMTSFNELDGIPATANSFLLKTILRDEWGFDGFVVTDYTSINEMIKHGTAADEYQAGGQALLAGVDMDMQGEVYDKHLEKLVADGIVTEDHIDNAVRNILNIKRKLGLFDDPYRYCDEEREKKLIYAKPHLKAAYDMACSSFVLLKNDHQLLPLKPSRNIAVIGPLAEAQRDLLGSWQAVGEWENAETVLNGIKRNNAGGKTAYAKGCDIDSDDRSGFAEAVKIARNSDIVVMVLGEAWNMTGEAACRTDIDIPGLQTELLEEIKKTGKPIVIILMNGRPLTLEKESLLADSILEVWLPGLEGGKAAADTIFGKYNPSGKLPVTFPRNVGQIPLHYNMKNTGRPADPAKPDFKYASRYIDSPNDPLYPFGFGLSYTKFTYSELKLNSRTLKPGGKITVTTTVKNTGDHDGEEVVQLYIRDLVASVTRPVKELKGFQKIKLKKGESRRIVFAIGHEQLQFLRRDMTWGTEAGQFEVFVGTNSRDVRSAKFDLIK